MQAQSGGIVIGYPIGLRRVYPNRPRIAQVSSAQPLLKTHASCKSLVGETFDRQCMPFGESTCQ
jgi:hypothetical protein